MIWRSWHKSLAPAVSLLRQCRFCDLSDNLPAYSTAAPDMPANPNYTWGYGIIDAAAAVKASKLDTGTAVTVVEF